MLKFLVAFLTLIMVYGCETFIVDNRVKTTTVTWIYVDDVIKTCNDEFKKHSIKQKILVNGCAVWAIDFSSCTIITGKETSERIVGHEIRHCFEGHFHP